MTNVSYYKNPVPSISDPGLPGAGAQTTTPVDPLQAALAILEARGVSGS
jgi:hypothetical protein